MSANTRILVAKFLSFLAGGFVAIGLLTLMGLTQYLDEQDSAQAAQVTACSQAAEAVQACQIVISEK